METSDLAIQRLLADLKEEIKHEMTEQIKPLKSDFSTDILTFNRDRVREEGRIRDDLSKLTSEFNDLKRKMQSVGQLVEKNQRAERRIKKLEQDQKTFINQVNQSKEKVRLNENKVKSINEDLQRFDSSVTTMSSIIENLMSQYGHITQFIEKAPQQITQQAKKQAQKDCNELKILLEKTKLQLQGELQKQIKALTNQILPLKRFSQKKVITQDFFEKEINALKRQILTMKVSSDNDQNTKTIQLHENQIKQLKTELSTLRANDIKLINLIETISKNYNTINNLVTTLSATNNNNNKQIKTLKDGLENYKALLVLTDSKLERKIAEIEKVAKKSSASTQSSAYSALNSNLVSSSNFYSSSASQSRLSQATTPPNFYSGIIQKTQQSPLKKSGSEKNLSKGNSSIDPTSQNFWRYRIDGYYIEKRYTENLSPSDLPVPLLGSIPVSTKKTNTFTIENKNGPIYLGIYRKVPTFFGDQKIETVCYNAQDGRVYLNGSLVNSGKTSYIKDKIQMTVSLNKVTWSVDYMLRGQYKQLTTRHSSEWYPFVIIGKADDKVKWE